MIHPAAHKKQIGWLAVALSLVAWAMQWGKIVEPCIYCEAQRVAIALLGLILILPHFSFFSRFFACLIGFYGAHVATEQNFIELKTQHTLSLEWVLSLLGLSMIVALTVLILAKSHAPDR